MSEVPFLDEFIFEAIEWDISNHVMTLTLNRPEVKNAINAAMTNELLYCLKYAKEKRDIRVVVIAAKGTLFCSGADLKMMSGTKSETRSNVPHQGDFADITRKIRGIYKPVIIKAQGPVMAGALLMTCNATHVIASDNVTFSAPEIKRGLWPYMVMASLFRVMPRRAGLDFIMRGYKIDAHQAKEWGLASDVVEADQLDERVAKLAQELANLAPGTMQLGLEAFYHQEDQTVAEALPYLQQMLTKTLASPDAQEGISAFIQKREAKWD